MRWRCGPSRCPPRCDASPSDPSDAAASIDLGFPSHVAAQGTARAAGSITRAEPRVDLEMVKLTIIEIKHTRICIKIRTNNQGVFHLSGTFGGGLPSNGVHLYLMHRLAAPDLAGDLLSIVRVSSGRCASAVNIAPRPALLTPDRAVMSGAGQGCGRTVTGTQQKPARGRSQHFGQDARAAAAPASRAGQEQLAGNRASRGAGLSSAPRQRPCRTIPSERRWPLHRTHSVTAP